MNTLVTISGGTCSGKDTLLRALVNGGYKKIISTTTRKIRSGEVDGFDYYFISDEESKRIEAANEFAEHMMYSGYRYGITKAEFQEKLITSDSPAVMICEPIGLHEYVAYARTMKVRLFTVFVNTPLEVREKRLMDRELQDLDKAKLLESSDEEIAKIVKTYLDRKPKLIEEQDWGSSRDWDLIVGGTESVNMLATIVRFAVGSTNWF